MIRANISTLQRSNFRDKALDYCRQDAMVEGPWSLFSHFEQGYHSVKETSRKMQSSTNEKMLTKKKIRTKYFGSSTKFHTKIFFYLLFSSDQFTFSRIFPNPPVTINLIIREMIQRVCLSDFTYFPLIKVMTINFVHKKFHVRGTLVLPLNRLCSNMHRSVPSEIMST